MLPLVGLWQGHLLVCLIVIFAMRVGYLFIYELGFNWRLAEPAASALVGGALRRGTARLNRQRAGLPF